MKTLSSMSMSVRLASSRASSASDSFDVPEPSMPVMRSSDGAPIGADATIDTVIVDSDPSTVDEGLQCVFVQRQ